MKKLIVFPIILIIPLFFAGCGNDSAHERLMQLAKNSGNEILPRVESILSPEERSKLTPDLVLESLKAGNLRFMGNDLTVRDHSKQIREAIMGQYPKAVVLTCIDSRIPVEDIFDRGIGDMFVTRVSGNVAGEEIIGSMEYASRLAGAKLIMVLGHEHCQAVISAIDGVDLGNFSHVMDKIKPAIENATEYEGEKTSHNPEYVELVTRNNINLTVRGIREGSSILQEMEKKGEIKIVGAYYDLDAGEVRFPN
jgi:carbonic anhydrase